MGLSTSFFRDEVFVKDFKDNDRHQLDLNHVPKCWPRCHLFAKSPPQVWGVVSRAQEVASQLTSLSSAATPEQAHDNIIAYLYYLSRAGTK